jgi:hypothetical protein
MLTRHQQMLIEKIAQLAHHRLDLLEVQYQSVFVEAPIDLHIDPIIVPVQALSAPVRKDQKVSRREFEVLLGQIEAPMFHRGEIVASQSAGAHCY